MIYVPMWLNFSAFVRVERGSEIGITSKDAYEDNKVKYWQDELVVELCVQTTPTIARA